jgi:hypothetical protein
VQLVPTFQDEKDSKIFQTLRQEDEKNLVGTLATRTSAIMHDILSQKAVTYRQKIYFVFKVCKSVHHRTIQIIHQPDAKIFQFIILTFIYSSTCFGRFSAHHQELNDCNSRLWFYLRIVVIVVLCSWSGRPAATAVIELLLMGGKTPETC